MTPEIKTKAKAPTQELIPFVLFHQLGIDPQHFCNVHMNVEGQGLCVQLNTFVNRFDAGEAGYRILKKYDEGFVIAKKCAAGHGHESESLGLICLGAVAAA